MTRLSRGGEDASRENESGDSQTLQFHGKQITRVKKVTVSVGTKIPSPGPDITRPLANRWETVSTLIPTKKYSTPSRGPTPRHARGVSTHTFLNELQLRSGTILSTDSTCGWVHACVCTAWDVVAAVSRTWVFPIVPACTRPGEFSASRLFFLGTVCCVVGVRFGWVRWTLCVLCVCLISIKYFASFQIHQGYSFPSRASCILLWRR